MLINCDIGERGPDHGEDLELLHYIDIANIACGGHAGDANSVRVFSEAAQEHGVTISAHLSYPDRKNFGRKSIDVFASDLIDSLDEQLDELPQARTVKFHGALYHDSAKDEWLAHMLAHWLRGRGVQTLIAAPGSALSGSAASLGIAVLKEGFADRKYVKNEDGFTLVDRREPDAELQPITALFQADELSAGRLQGHPYCVQTLCIHSDGKESLTLARNLVERTPPFSMSNPGMCTLVFDPVYGQQHTGKTPGGPQDRFSFACGKKLLGQSRGIGMEWISPPTLKIDRSALMILTGAETEGVALFRGESMKPVFHSRTFEVRRGDVLSFSKTVIGYRGQILWRAFDESLRDHVGRKRPQLKTFASFRNAQGPIRIFPGPEKNGVENSDEIVARPWVMSNRHSGMGIRLEPVSGNLRKREHAMSSAPVTDGTIQWTPTGPIILMRHRQTVGGYPRIAQVCEVDIDRVAQFKPGDVLTFRWISPEEAEDLLVLQKQALALI